MNFIMERLLKNVEVLECEVATLKNNNEWLESLVCELKKENSLLLDANETTSEAVKIYHFMLRELRNAEKKHPLWPSDVVHASAILNEEAGELTQAALDFYNGKEGKAAMVEEALHTGAMALRFLLNIDSYEPGNKK